MALLLAASVLALAAPPARPAAEEPFGRFRAEVRDLAEPAACAVSADGRLHVVEAAGHRVRILDADGKELGRFGSFGSGPGELCAPRGVALAPDGTVYVSDTGNHRVQAFSPEGEPLAAFGSLGAGPGELAEPRGLCVAGGRVYVADSGNDRVGVFARDGRFLGAVGRRGSAPGELRRPVDVVYEATGAELYVADSDNSRIQRFAVHPEGADGDGLAAEFVGQWGDWGGYDGQLDGPAGIDLLGQEVFVADEGNHRVQVFDLAGGYRSFFGVHALRPREGAGKIHYPGHVALAPDGAFVVVCETFENRLQVFGRRRPEDPPPLPPPGAVKEGGATHFGRYAATAADLLVTLAPETHAVIVHDTTPDSPVRISVVGGYGSRNGAFVRPSGLALGDAGRRLLAGDAGGRRLQEFRLDHDPADPLRFEPGLARFARSLDFERLGREVCGRELSWTVEPGALALAPGGEVYVLDVRNELVLVLGPDLLPRRVFGGHGDGPGRLRHPTDLALAPDGSAVYVVDAHNFRVQAFGPDGVPRGTLGARGEGAGELAGPTGIAVAGDGSVYVADEVLHRVQVFGPDGAPRASFGSRGIGRGELYKPRGLCWDGDGRLFVVDYGNHRIQRFTADGSYVDVFGARWFVQPALREAGR